MFNLLQKLEKRTESIRRDTQLPALPALIDPRSVVAFLAEKTEGIIPSSAEGRITYIRYKPETNCLIAYATNFVDSHTGEAKEILLYAKCFTTPDFLNAVQKAHTRRWVTPLFGLPVISLPEWNTLFYLFPNDALIKGLRVVASPKKIQRLLYRYLDSDNGSRPGFESKIWRISDRRLKTTVLRYKPERRAVLRCQTRAVHRETGQKRSVVCYLRFYADDCGTEIFRTTRQLYNLHGSSAFLETPAGYGYEANLRLLIIGEVGGIPLLNRFEQLCAESQPEELQTDFQRIAKALAVFHKSPLSQPGMRVENDFLSELAVARATLEFLVPELQAQIALLVTSLQSQPPDFRPTGLMHGDLHFGQILIAPEKIGFLDFDRTTSGPGLYDVGNFLANLWLLKVGGRIANPQPLAIRFVEAYQKAAKQHIPQSAINWWTAFCLVLLAVEPFRRFETDWSLTIRKIVETAQERLVT